MDKVYLQWNFPNWITVLIMASLGTVLVGAMMAGFATLSGDTENE